MSKTTVSPTQVQHIADLATIPLTQQETQQLAQAFEETLVVVDDLQTADTSAVNETHQVTGLENVWREDAIDESRVFTQEQALANAKRTHQGFVVVQQVIDQS